jgi:dTDP-4-amino-4,6-dideoxy-D-galactose acyltransferase
MIRRLDWDSRFFDYEVGRFDSSIIDILDLDLFIKSAKYFKLVYLFSSTPINNPLLNLVDKKVTFYRKTENFHQNTPQIQSFCNDSDSFENIRDLAIQSGKYSRFLIDKNFKNNEYEKLYSKWIESSVYDDRSLDIRIFKEDNKILGFTTIEKKDDNLADIGLVAVDSEDRGKKIGTKLIENSINVAFKNGLQNIQVVTQLDNKPAVKLYSKCGFKICKTEYIYHYWNL